MARLQLVPPHDPQFRRNRERVARDAERENLLIDWDLGVPKRATDRRADVRRRRDAAGDDHRGRPRWHEGARRGGERRQRR